MKAKTVLAVIATVVTLLTACWVVAQGRPARRHTVTKSRGKPRLVAASQKPITRPAIEIEVDGRHRIIRANGVPAHDTGSFPNRGNPHRIEAQRYTYRVPAQPRRAERVTPLGLHSFGIAVNGVPFDPGAAEWYLGDRHGGWRYEALSGAIPLGIDEHHAHVQPTGAYHYHGIPKGLLDASSLRRGQHSPIVGWAADGFPIYAIFGYTDVKNPKSEVRALKPSFRLKSGERPSGRGQPGGRYDGTFTADYEYVAGLGDLDECNGRRTVTPEYPGGTYAYFLTETWPVIPRAYRGTPSEELTRRRPPRGRRRR